jgi:hypothetical protein
MTGLQARLLAAHADNDRHALVALYQEAADTSADPVAQGFFLTHAYVFALELGDPRASDLHARLKAQGRDS